jgi:septal ring factor EnvC (AmiA/AmiB activator)
MGDCARDECKTVWKDYVKLEDENFEMLNSYTAQEGRLDEARSVIDAARADADAKDAAHARELGKVLADLREAQLGRSTNAAEIGTLVRQCDTLKRRVAELDALALRVRKLAARALEDRAMTARYQQRRAANRAARVRCYVCFVEFCARGASHRVATRRHPVSHRAMPPSAPRSCGSLGWSRPRRRGG